MSPYKLEAEGDLNTLAELERQELERHAWEAGTGETATAKETSSTEAASEGTETGHNTLI
jgi:hypothetical protein